MAEAENLEETPAESPPTPYRSSVTPIVRSRLKRLEHAITIHAVLAEIGTTKQDLESPEYWKMVAPMMRIGDHVYVDCEAGRFFAELKVRQVGINSVGMRCLRWADFDDDEASISDTGYRVKWGNRHTGHRVIRLSDNEVVLSAPEGTQWTQEQAEREMRDWLQALRR